MKTLIIALLPFLLVSCNSESNKFLEDKFNVELTAQVQYYNGNKLANVSQFEFTKKRALLEKSNETWECVQTENISNETSMDLTYSFQLTKGEASAAGVAVNFSFNEWDKDNYIIMPAGAYNGNRFDVIKYTYPPLFKKDKYKVDMPITITDVPRLNKYNGKSRMDLNTGDLTTPAIGIFFPKTKKGIWILTEQSTELGNSVLTLEENEDRTKAQFRISAPCVREQKYGMMNLYESDETGVDWTEKDKATVKCKIFTFDDINSPAELNNQFLTIRKSFGQTNYVNQLPFSKAFELMEKQQNEECWDEKNGFYGFGGDGWNSTWQLGWVGGCMLTHSLSLIGSPISQERAFLNYNNIINKSQAKSGFYYGCGNGKAWCSDCFSNPFPDNLLLLRKNADALYYFYKYCLAQKTIHPDWKMPIEWKKPLGKFADAFVTLWNRHGQFGQFIDIETGEIKVGGTNSAAIAIGGLALASKFENRPELLQTAKEAARYYYNEFVKKGISCGGPGEILQNNDAESAFATLESFITLYEVTGEKEWLKYSEDAAALCATWVVSYDYKFPAASTFGKLDMRSTGSVWASTQNKHGGPGICTFSGDCLLKLYRSTGNKLYLRLLGDIAHNIMQYISREDRQIHKQKSGWANERVNLSDWEGKQKVGEIFDGSSNWVQTSVMQTVTEIPGIYVNPAKDELFVFDHVNATLEGNQIKITNPTKFDATVKIFIDNEPSKPYLQGFVSQCPEVEVKAGESTIYEF